MVKTQMLTKSTIYGYSNVAVFSSSRVNKSCNNKDTIPLILTFLLDERFRVGNNDVAGAGSSPARTLSRVPVPYVYDSNWLVVKCFSHTTWLLNYNRKDNWIWVYKHRKKRITNLK
jgi:hypothetical protein